MQFIVVKKGRLKCYIMQKCNVRARTVDAVLNVCNMIAEHKLKLIVAIIQCVSREFFHRNPLNFA